MMPGYLVLLEETADREAEARVVTYGDESTISVMAVTPVVVPWTQEKMVTHARHVSRFVARLVGCVAIAIASCRL